MEDATLKKLDERKVRVLFKCECGQSYAFDVSADKQGKMEVDTILLKGKKDDAGKPTHIKSIFDAPSDEDDTNETD